MRRARHGIAQQRKLWRGCALAGAAFLLSIGGNAMAQVTGTTQPAPNQASHPQGPGQLDLLKLVWSTMAAVDNANTSGNYSVLRDNAASSFQMANDQARLTGIFAGLRASRLDLANALLVVPTFTAEPRFLQPDVIQLQGVFQIRPVPIRFDLIYQWEQGRWKLFGINVGPLEAATAPAPAPTPQDSTKRGGR